MGGVLPRINIGTYVCQCAEPARLVVEVDHEPAAAGGLDLEVGVDDPTVWSDRV